MSKTPEGHKSIEMLRAEKAELVQVVTEIIKKSWVATTPTAGDVFVARRDLYDKCRAVLAKVEGEVITINPKT